VPYFVTIIVAGGRAYPNFARDGRITAFIWTVQ
jgi:hypothetical protein